MTLCGLSIVGERARLVSFAAVEAVLLPIAVGVMDTRQRLPCVIQTHPQIEQIDQTCRFH